MKPLEVFGIFIGVAGLGVGVYALFFRRPAPPPPPPAATAGYVAPVQPQLPPGTSSRTPPATDPTLATINGVAGAVTSIAGAIGSLADLFGGM